MDRFYAWVGALVGRIESEKGQTFVEYALILTLIAVAVAMLATWGGLVTAIGAAIDDVASHL
jgi:Flp pilus assembly pilin Flp